ncbi:glycoside hydrolase domain-containing protein [Streptomyces sp. NPDC055099]
MDEMVLKAQKFVNSVYGGRIGRQVEENGRTAWPLMYALTRALQWELGIAPLSDAFGATTLSTLQSKHPKINASTAPSADFIRLVQAALYAKGYDGGGIDGKYSDRVASSVSRLKANMGVDTVYPGSDLVPKVFKGLLNMDAYVAVDGGSDTIREIQQWLNGRYVHRRNFYIIPCDGHYSRDVAKSTMYAVQYEIGMSDDVANGNFGPGTQAGLKNHTLSISSRGTWVLLFSASMVFNQRSGVGFDGTFTASLADSVRDFQKFVKLPVTGLGDFQTWASLLVSYGDQDRRGAACDGVTKVTPARAETLKAAGIEYVGRYLYNPDPTPSGDLKHKEIQPGELKTIADHGLRCFPIFQTFADSASYFNDGQGVADARLAVTQASKHGFKRGARIFFAVDYDTMDGEVTSNVIPYFRAIAHEITNLDDPYRVGVYGTRNVCARVAAAGYTGASFVSDMSSGYSGNLGYPMPTNWAYDQIVTRTIGSGDGAIEIDHNIASGRDTGENSFDPIPSGTHLDTDLPTEAHGALLTEIRQTLQSLDPPIGETSANTKWSTKQSLDLVLHNDALITGMARTLKIRKSLIQVPVFWETRHYDTSLDYLGDLGVRVYHSGVQTVPPVADAFIKRDASTGPGQIFAVTAISARNQAITDGILGGSTRDPNSDDDVWTIWQKLNGEPEFNIRQVPYVHRYHAVKYGVPRPSLTTTPEELFDLLKYYQGDNANAETEAAKRLKVYGTFERYNAISRGDSL